MQLDLLSYVPTAEELTPVQAIAPPKPMSLHAIHRQRCADVYLSLMSCIARGERLPQLVKRHEIGRLMAMREHALERAKEAQNAT